MNKAALTAAASLLQSGSYTNWNQRSDQAVAHQQTAVHPTHGNSLKSTLTSGKPGSGAPGGKGVDVKHDSYARFLNKRKGQVLRTQTTNVALAPKQGNKIKTYGLMSNTATCCTTKERGPLLPLIPLTNCESVIGALTCASEAPPPFGEFTFSPIYSFTVPYTGTYTITAISKGPDPIIALTIIPTFDLACDEVLAYLENNQSVVEIIFDPNSKSTPSLQAGTTYYFILLGSLGTLNEEYIFSLCDS